MSLGHRKLSTWYQQLAQNLEAGLRLTDALRLSRGVGVPAAGLEAMAGKIEAGGTVDDALREGGTWLPYADLLALSAAAEAGRMPRILRSLSVRHAHIGAAKMRIVLACIYPLGLLHVALLFLPAARMMDWERGFQWNGPAYLLGVAATILPLWILGLWGWILVRRQSPVLARIAQLIPVVGRYMRTQALADFSFALGNFLEAGVPISQAWAAAGLITRSPALKAAADDTGEVIARGAAPGTRLAAHPCFPADFIARYRTGETTGQLEANLLHLAADYQDSANRALGFATILYPALLFLTVAGVVVYVVVTIYLGYLKMLGKYAG
jgi:general secretion pathway protein F/type IV pilus assembly protein PilC